MHRIVILGNIAAGKSTLARWIHARLGLPLHHLDQVQFSTGWKRIPIQEYEQRHQEILQEPAWIIDGLGDAGSIEARLRRADTIILLDYRIGRNLWWLIKRFFTSLIVRRQDCPARCAPHTKGWYFLKLMWFIRRNRLPHVRRLIETLQSQKEITCVRNMRQLKRLHSEIEQRCMHLERTR